MIICEKCGAENIFDGASHCKKCLKPLHQDKRHSDLSSSTGGQDEEQKQIEQTAPKGLAADRPDESVLRTDKSAGAADDDLRHVKNDSPVGIVGQPHLSEAQTDSAGSGQFSDPHKVEQSKQNELAEATADQATSIGESADDDDLSFEIKEVASSSGTDLNLFGNETKSDQLSGHDENEQEQEKDIIIPEAIEKELTLYRDDEMQLRMEQTEDGPAITLTDISGQPAPPELKPLEPTGGIPDKDVPPELSHEEMKIDRSEEGNITRKIIINPVIEKLSVGKQPEKETLFEKFASGVSPTSKVPDSRSQPAQVGSEDGPQDSDHSTKKIDRDDSAVVAKPQTKTVEASRPMQSSAIAHFTGNKITLAGGIKLSTGDEMTIGGKSFELRKKPSRKTSLLVGIGGGILFVVLLLMLSGVFSTGKSGYIVGILKDPQSGELVTGAAVTIKELGKSTQISQAGFFIFDGVAPGIYTVEVPIGTSGSNDDSGVLSERLSVVGGRTSTVSFVLPKGKKTGSGRMGNEARSIQMTARDLQDTPAEKYGFMKLTLSPSAAKVYLDGEYIGKNSQTFKVPTGKHKVTVKSKGYKDLTKNVTVKDNQISSYGFKLKKAASSKSARQKTDEELATELEEAGKYSQALGYYKKVLQREPDNLEALMGSARCYKAKGDGEKALSAYLKASKMAGERNDTPSQLGALSGVLEINPNYLTARYARGLIYLNQGEHYKAALDFNKVIEIDPRNLNAHYKLGEAYFKSKNYPAALQTYRQTQNLNFADAKPYAYMAKIYLAMGDLKKAKKYYKSFEENADLATKNRFANDQQWLEVKQAVGQ